MGKPARQQRLKYEPFAFALAFVALVSKIVSSNVADQQVLDPFLWLFAAVFAITAVVYVVDLVFKGSSRPRIVRAEIKAGKIDNSEIVGASGAPDQVEANLRMGDVTGSTVTGVRYEK